MRTNWSLILYTAVLCTSGGLGLLPNAARASTSRAPRIVAASGTGSGKAQPQDRNVTTLRLDHPRALGRVSGRTGFVHAPLHGRATTRAGPQRRG